MHEHDFSHALIGQTGVSCSLILSGYLHYIIIIKLSLTLGRIQDLVRRGWDKHPTTSSNWYCNSTSPFYIRGFDWTTPRSASADSFNKIVVQYIKEVQLGCQPEHLTNKKIREISNQLTPWYGKCGKSVYRYRYTIHKINVRTTFYLVTCIWMVSAAILSLRVPELRTVFSHCASEERSPAFTVER